MIAHFLIDELPTMSLSLSPCLTAVHNRGVQPLLLALMTSSILHASAASNAEARGDQNDRRQLAGVKIAIAGTPAKDASHSAGSMLRLTG